MKRLTISIIITLVTTLWFSIPARADYLHASGKITTLNVHEIETVHTKIGEKHIFGFSFMLDTLPDTMFRFKLYREILDLLRDAFNNDWNVTIDYYVISGTTLHGQKKIGEIQNIEITKYPIFK